MGGKTGQQHTFRSSPRALLVGATALAVGCSKPPDLARGETGPIARVSDGDALTPDNGVKVRLVEVEAPAPGYDSRPDEPIAPEARALLLSAARGRTAQLYYGGLSRDRYDRALAHVIAKDETGADLWLNGLMVLQGAARVRTFPDNARRVRQLYVFEEEARQAKRGLWALDHWRVRALDDLSDPPYFAILEGALASMNETTGEGSVRITRAGLVFATGDGLGAKDDALKLEAGKLVRVRGRIDTRDGEPVMGVMHWGQLETP